MDKKLAFCLTLIFLLTVIATADTLNVPTALYPSIQSAITAANPGDEVVIADGTYKGDPNKNLDFGGKAITVRSANGNPANCIIDCGNNGRGFYFHNAENPAAVVQGFKIINGDEYYGGAIECEEASPTIENCILTNNTAAFGGAIDCFAASPLIINCIITSNSSDYDGGAIECGSESSPLIKNCLIADNNAVNGYGGAIDCYDLSSPEIINCTIANNTGNSEFGGVYATTASSPAIKSCILWNNGNDIYGAAATYSCIQDGDAGTGNISSDPMFRRGPYPSDSNYYLSQTAAGQFPPDSNCVNTGGDPNDPNHYSADAIFGSGHPFTTRTDNVPDSNTVDMGFHYPNSGTDANYVLITGVNPNITCGTIEQDPNLPFYKQFADVNFTATPAGGYKILRWIDANTATYDPCNPATFHTTPGPNDVFTVVMDANKTVIVEFSSTATYKLITYVVGGNGSIGKVDPNDYPDPNDLNAYFIPQNTIATITARPNAGYVVKRWTKGDTATFNINDPNTYIVYEPNNILDPNFSILIDSNTTITVEFKYQQYLLNTHVNGGHGTISPKRGYYPIGTTVQLTATPDDGYRVKSWGNDADSKPGWNVITNTVTMSGPKDVNVVFELGTSRLIHVFGDVNGIQNAINEANNGDTIQIHPGTYVGTGFYIDKVITIVGDPEHPENVIIDYLGEWGQYHRGFYLAGQGGNPNPVTLNGVKIINLHSFHATPFVPPYPVPLPGTDGLNGFDNYNSAAITILGNHTVKNCIISNCFIATHPATDGIAGHDPNEPNSPNGGDGGWGGSVGGAGIYVESGNPDIINVLIEDCCAIGGNAGNGAPGYSDQNDWTDGNPDTPYFPPGTSGDGGNGGDADGAGIYIASGNPKLTNVTVRNCVAIAGNGGNGADGAADASGADGGLPGRVRGAGIYCAAGSLPVFANCTIENCKGYGGRGGNGSNAGEVIAEGAPGVSHDGGYGGLTTVAASGQGDIRTYSTHGGAIYCGSYSNVFTNCTFTGNMTYGSISGLGGHNQPYWWQQQPRKNYLVPSFGAGVLCSTGSTSSFSGCLFEDNRTAYNEDFNDPCLISYDGEYTGRGGGLCLWSALTADINDCNFIENSAPIGGGIYGELSQVHIRDSNIINNASYAGGGVLVLDSIATISKSIIKGNAAGTQSGLVQDIGYALFGTGGGIYALSSLMDVNNCIVTENYARLIGGGICLDGDYWLAIRPLIKNCLITDNRAIAQGGGIAAIYFAEPKIQNCTIADNIVSDANSNGGGLFVSYAADVIVKDTIFWNNSGLDGSQIALSSGGPFTDMPSELVITYSDIDLRYTSGFDTTQEQSSSGSTFASRLVDSQTIYNEINTTGSAKVIVSLDEPTEILETLNWSSPASVNSLRSEIASRQNQVLSTLSAGEFTLRHKLTNIAIFSGQITQAGLTKLLANPMVTHIEADKIRYPELAQGIPLMNALGTRGTFNGQGISVAICDTGVDYTHPMLGGGSFPNSKVIGGYDTADNDNDPIPGGTTASTGHGTCCAGIAAGSLGTVGDYIGGIAYNTKIYALKISSNTFDGAYDSDIIAAWDWCVTHMNDNPAYPIKVISFSFGGGKYASAEAAEADSPALANTAKRAVAAGITILAASGNDGYTDSLASPAAFSSIISVGAVYDAAFISQACGVQTQPDRVTCYSNTADILDILASSENAYTTDIVGTAGYDTGDYYQYFNGTSAACPYAAGAVAALQNAAKQLTGNYLTPSQVRSILIATGDAVTDTKVAITKPRVNLGAAIALLGTSVPVYVDDPRCTLVGLEQDANNTWTISTGSHNIDDDPNFVLGYYLSHKDAGQDYNSPCFDIGSDTAVNLGLNIYTTRIDGVNDVDIVDLGYHYTGGLLRYELRITADANGTIEPPWEPNIYPYLIYENTTVTLHAIPKPNFRVSMWTLDGVQFATNNRYFTVTMDGPHSVTVSFEFYAPHSLFVPDQYANIQDAINSAKSGDTIYIYRKADGSPYYITDPNGLDFKGKALTIRSEDPNDPNIVAATIIDCNGRGRAFIFQNQEDANSIIEGLTIANASTAGYIAQGTQPDPIDANIVNGKDAIGDGFGGAIYCGTNTSPIIRNCVFSNCEVTGGRGSDGLDGYDLAPDDTRDRGGKGGNGGNGSGNGYGGAIYCGQNSTPTILNCTINNCTARGGIGGNGGNGGNGTSGKLAGDGGNGGNGTGNGYGGAIYVSINANPKIIGCNFYEGTASMGLAGARGLQGAGQIPTQAPYPYDGVDGQSTGTGFAGAIYYEKTSTADINDCNFIDNTADADTTGTNDTGGGAIYCEPNCANIKMLKTTMSGNQTIRGSGGAVRCGARNHITLKDCYFGGNTANDGGGALAIGDRNDANKCILDFNSCAFTDNTAGNIGGAIMARNFDANFIDCYINRNMAASGGGLYLIAVSTAKIYGGTIMNNSATGTNAEGGGAFVSNMPVEIINCQIIGNTSLYSGGGIMLKGENTTSSKIHNCLFAENSAGARGGALLVSLNTSPKITSCTFSENGTEPGGAGGAIFCTYASSPTIKDCIFDQTKRVAVYENSDDSDPNISYCMFYENFDGDLYDRDSGITYNTRDSNNPDVNLAALNIATNGNNVTGRGNNPLTPLFVTGDLGKYYLSQPTAADANIVKSPAIDAGIADANTITVLTGETMADYTTRIDSNDPNVDAGDAYQLDIGFHYIDIEPNRPRQFELTTAAVGGHGSIKPPSGLFYAGTTVEITALPNPGWRVNNWTGTDNDSSTNTTNYVIMIGKRAVMVSFEQPKNLYVPGEYTSLQNAVNDAKNGDKIILSRGIYAGAESDYDYTRIIINGKNITITGTNPDDPCIVAQTILQGNGFEFMNVDSNMILDGITIQDAHYWYGVIPCDQTWSHGPTGDGINGGSIFGGAVAIYNASPTIRNCRFVRCSALAVNGCEGQGDYGDGGWAGWAHGGAVAIDRTSNPIFKNCQFIDCYAQGSNGMNGSGRWGHGGNWGDPNDNIFHTWDFGPYEEPSYYSGYGGAIYCMGGSKPQFENCLFQGNRAYGGVCGISGSDHPAGYPMQHYAIDSFGGAVYLAAGSEAKFTDCNFIDNEAHTRGQIAGSDPNVPNIDTLGVAIADTVLYDSVVSYGGAICAEGTTAAIPVIKNCTFTDNRACAGGGIYWEDSIAHISRCTLEDNISMLGGAMLLTDSNSIIFECDFSDNQAVDPAGQGGAIYCASSDADFYDCEISNNQVSTSGGGAYFTGELEPNMHNCLIIHNNAGRDGGGISANWDSQPVLSNCIIANNAVIGGGFASGYGGGLSCAYEANTKVINSIIWNNNAEYGPEISIGSNFDAADKLPAEVNVSYSDVKGGAADVFVDGEHGCKLNWDPDPNNNLEGTSLTSPIFVSGYWGDYYLSQPTEQNTTSPCVDRGLGLAIDNDMYRHTTRTDHVTIKGQAIDSGIVDMGYHYTLTAEILGDFNFDGIVDEADLALFNLYWMDTDCIFPYYCHERDITEDGEVDFEDFAAFAANYGLWETTPPKPDPMTWKTKPQSAGTQEITMTATTARDNSGSLIQYYFDCYDGNCHDKEWDPCSMYTDTGLTGGMQYGYRVRAKDERNNVTGWSVISYAVPGEDSTPPTPNPMTWLQTPIPTSPNSITMTATTATDISGVEYYFNCVSPGCHDCNWQDSTVYEDFGLNLNTTYTYTVQARDKSPLQNATQPSGPASATTPDINTVIIDTDPPTPNPSQWALVPLSIQGLDANHPTYWFHQMTAGTASDANSPPVEYYFECVSGGGTSSGWITFPSGQPATYTAGPFLSANHAAYRVYTRDSAQPNRNVGLPSPTWHTYYGLIP